jgi:hypothetical protein
MLAHITSVLGLVQSGHPQPPRRGPVKSSFPPHQADFASTLCSSPSSALSISSELLRSFIKPASFFQQLTNSCPLFFLLIPIVFIDFQTLWPKIGGYGLGSIKPIKNNDMNSPSTSELSSRSRSHAFREWVKDLLLHFPASPRLWASHPISTARCTQARSERRNAAPVSCGESILRFGALAIFPFFGKPGERMLKAHPHHPRKLFLFQTHSPGVLIFLVQASVKHRRIIRRNHHCYPMPKQQGKWMLLDSRLSKPQLFC